MKARESWRSPLRPLTSEMPICHAYALAQGDLGSGLRVKGDFGSLLRVKGDVGSLLRVKGDLGSGLRVKD